MDLHCNIRASFDVCTHLSADLIVFVNGEKAYLLPVALRKKNKNLLRSLKTRTKFLGWMHCTIYNSLL